jgi:hypothetical protein
MILYGIFHSYRIQEFDVMILVFEVGAVAAKDIIAADGGIGQFLVFSF